MFASCVFQRIVMPQQMLEYIDAKIIREVSFNSSLRLLNPSPHFPASALFRPLNRHCFIALAQKTTKESVTIEDELLFTNDGKSGETKPVSVVLKAKVFRKTQGTPLLKDGIKRIGKRTDLMSDVESEFEGFAPLP
mmetsp:Transcript_11083/g.17732  ORF Transcript_11083/g.17732 Transcript_11083/m.17732 type:complete len:136 (-) Transcript_11083:214-621(-)